MTTPVDPVNWWRSFICLATAVGMVQWGDAVLRPCLQGSLGAAYWGVCLGFAIFTVIFGMRDLRAVRQSARMEHVAVIRRAHREFSRVRGGSQLDDGTYRAP